MSGPRLSGEARHVAVQGRDATAMLQNDNASVAPLRTGECNPSVASRLDDGSGRGCIVNALVSAKRVQNRVPTPRIEIGANAREIEGRAQKLTAHAASIRSEVVGDLAVSGFKVDRAMRNSAVGKVGGENASIADVLPFSILLLIDEIETSAGLNIEREVDIPTEDVIREPKDGLGAESRSACSYEQGGVDRALRGLLANFNRRRNQLGCEAVVARVTERISVSLTRRRSD